MSQRSYEGRAIRVLYDSRRCIHAGECVRGLPEVFDTGRKPWVDPDGAERERVAEIVTRCPSGALSFELAEAAGGTPGEPEPTWNVVEVSADGPLYARGRLRIVTSDGVAREETRVALCRCGASRNKPFCDNSHREIGFRDDGSLGGGRVRPTENAGGVLEIRLRPDASLRVDGPFELRGAGGSEPVRGDSTAFCRCGHSATKPFCDASHKTADFRAK